MQQIEFLAIPDPDSEDCLKALDLYEASFPLPERISREIFQSRLRRGLDELWVGKIGDRVVLFASLFPIPQSNLFFLSYLATDTTYRNMGIGSQFLQTLWQRLQTLDAYLLIELEPPHWGELAQRRIEFYRRHGAKLLQDVHYILPISEANPIDMILAIAPHYPAPTVSQQQVRTWLYQIYVAGYEQSPDHPSLQFCLSSVPETVVLQ